MQTIDPASGRSRGYLLLKRGSAAGATGGPSLLLSLDKSRYAQWPELRDWLIRLHLRQAQSGIVDNATGTAPVPFLQQEQEAEGFKRFLTELPPSLATLITPLPAAGAALAGVDGANGCNGTSPRATLRKLVTAIEVRGVVEDETAMLTQPYPSVVVCSLTSDAPNALNTMHARMYN